MKKFKGRMLVIGDIMLDHYIYGKVNRISPEAPVPVVSVDNESDMLGGCGNVINNLNNLGISVGLITVVGDDENGDKVLNKLFSLNINTDSVFKSKNVSTNYKMRIVANSQHVVRADWDSDKLDEATYKKMISSYKYLISDYDGVLISDYSKGVCADSFLKEIIKEANKKNIPIFVDPKGDDWGKYSGATFITPNSKEVSEVVDHDIKTDDDFIKIGSQIIDKYSINNCLITRGPDGMTFVEKDNHIHIKSDAQEVYDVSGAGDTVISCLAAAIINDYNYEDAVKLSNLAAGIVVSHIGTSAIRIEELSKW